MPYTSTMFKKLLLFFSFLAFFLIFLVPPTLAEGEFKTDVNVEYKIQQSGITTVSNTITLQNLFSDLYATSYTLVLDNIKAINVKASQMSKSLPIELNEEGSKTSIVVSFPDSMVGRGNKRTFNVSYDDATIAAKTGEVWEITIPRLASDSSFSSYNLSFSILLSFGQEAYLSPNPT